MYKIMGLRYTLPGFIFFCESTNDNLFLLSETTLLEELITLKKSEAEKQGRTNSREWIQFKAALQIIHDLLRKK